MGTKCNRLLRVAAEAPSRAGGVPLIDKAIVDVPLPARLPPSRAAAARRAAVAAAAALFGFAPQSSSERAQRDSCGIHAVEVSPDGAFVATGGANPCDMALLHGDTLGRAALCMVRCCALATVICTADESFPRLRAIPTGCSRCAG